VKVLGTPDRTSFFCPTKLVMSAPLKNFGVHGNFVKGPYTPFHTFDLGPGQARDLFFEAAHPTCAKWAAGSTDAVGGLGVKFRFLWRSSTVRLFAGRLAVVCPKAKR